MEALSKIVVDSINAQAIHIVQNAINEAKCNFTNVNSDDKMYYTNLELEQYINDNQMNQFYIKNDERIFEHFKKIGLYRIHSYPIEFGGEIIQENNKHNRSKQYIGYFLNNGMFVHCGSQLDINDNSIKTNTIYENNKFYTTGNQRKSDLTHQLTQHTCYLTKFTIDVIREICLYNLVGCSYQCFKNHGLCYCYTDKTTTKCQPNNNIHVWKMREAGYKNNNEYCYDKHYEECFKYKDNRHYSLPKYIHLKNHILRKISPNTQRKDTFDTIILINNSIVENNISCTPCEIQEKLNQLDKNLLESEQTKDSHMELNQKLEQLILNNESEYCDKNKKLDAEYNNKFEELKQKINLINSQKIKYECKINKIENDKLQLENEVTLLTCKVLSLESDNEQLEERYDELESSLEDEIIKNKCTSEEINAKLYVEKQEIKKIKAELQRREADLIKNEHEYDKKAKDLAIQQKKVKDSLNIISTANEIKNKKSRVKQIKGENIL